MKKSFTLIILLAVLCISCTLGATAFGAVEEVEEYPGTLTLMDKYEAMTNEYSTATWQFANAGSNAKGTYSVTDGAVDIMPEKGKGKMADSEEGFCFYYTKVDATKENFYLKATLTVTNWTGDNQNGFGLICTDTVGVQNTGRYMNYVAAGCYKTSGSDYNIPAARTVWGYISADGTSPSEDAAGAGDSLRQYSASKLNIEENHSAVKGEGSTYTFILRKSNTGYHAIMTSSPEGKGFAEKLYYDTGKLMAQDGDNPDEVYVGFFASRNVSVKVTDVFFTTPESATDERKYDEPPTRVPLKLSVLSPEYRYGSDYTYQMISNADGTLEVVDNKRNVYIQPTHVNAEEVFSQKIELPDSNYVQLITRFTPDSPYISAGSVTISVYRHSLPTVGGVTYADPFVKEGTGSGTKADPVNLSDALSYARPGNVIMLADGTYKPTRKIEVPRGVNGTQDKPIVLRAETVGGVTLDFSQVICKNEALLIAGDYWHVYGINVANTPSVRKATEEGKEDEMLSIKGIRISGSHNVLERCNAYGNSNTGIQISGNSNESYSCWPAYNLVKNCTSYNNCDPTRQDADGFGVKLTVGDGNVLYGCVAYNNVDDGYDLYAKSVTGSIGAVTIDSCIAYNNGYLTNSDLSKPELTGEGNGFKLGGEGLPGKHKLVNSLAFGNGAKGITSNSCPDVIIENCTVYNNNVYANFKAQEASNENVSLYAKRPGQQTAFVVSGLISIMDGVPSKTDKFALVGQSSIKAENNYLWNGSKCTNDSVVLTADSLFVNTDVNSVDTLITRDGKGDLVINGLLVLTPNAPADAGARIGVATSGGSGSGSTSGGSSAETDGMDQLQSQLVKDHFLQLAEQITQATTTEEKQLLLAQWDSAQSSYQFLSTADSQAIQQLRSQIEESIKAEQEGGESNQGGNGWIWLVIGFAVGAAVVAVTIVLSKRKSSK